MGPRLGVGLFQHPNPQLVLQVTGIQPEHPGGHASLDEAGFKSTQGLTVADANGGHVVGVWPGELKPNAEFLYSDHRAETLITTAIKNGWEVWANPHIAFHNAPPHQRLYLDPTIDRDAYIRLWEGSGWDEVGGHSQGKLADSLWPWLKKQGIATDADDPVFGEFLVDLGKRRTQVHLRAGLYAMRKWSRVEMTEADAREIRSSINVVLGAIGEPSFPVHVPPDIP